MLLLQQDTPQPVQKVAVVVIPVSREVMLELVVLAGALKIVPAGPLVLALLMVELVDRLTTPLQAVAVEALIIMALLARLTEAPVLIV